MAKFAITVTVSEFINGWTRSRPLPEFIIEAENLVQAIETGDSIVNPFQDWELGPNRTYTLNATEITQPIDEPPANWDWLL